MEIWNISTNRPKAPKEQLNGPLDDIVLSSSIFESQKISKSTKSHYIPNLDDTEISNFGDIILRYKHNTEIMYYHLIKMISWT